MPSQWPVTDADLDKILQSLPNSMLRASSSVVIVTDNYRRAIAEKLAEQGKWTCHMGPLSFESRTFIHDEPVDFPSTWQLQNLCAR